MNWTVFTYGLFALVILGMQGCSDEPQAPPTGTGDTSKMGFPGAPYAGKSDVFGRALVGPAAPYIADPSLAEQEEQLRSHMGQRRAMGWKLAKKILEPVPLLGLTSRAPNDSSDLKIPDDMPTLPRWQTWYGVDDFKRIFRRAYGNLSMEERGRRTPISDDQIEDAFAWNAAALERSERWPLARFIRHVNSLGTCPDSLTDEECARTVQSNFSGGAGGNARITYSPGAISHFLKNYGELVACEEKLSTLGLDQDPIDDSKNFSLCFNQEFASNAVLMKAHWLRADFGRKVPVYDTDAQTLSALLSTEKSGDWGVGQREADPDSDSIYTIRLRNGDVYRLAGLHIMTKELRHWTWVTLWWSDTPETDFGADRPKALFDELDPVWSNYKMNVVVDYEELDPNPEQWFAEFPTLASALKAVHSNYSWSSNPYIEHGRGNAKTNCIGCHQHGGSSVGQDLNSDGVLDPIDLERVISDDTFFPNNGRPQMRTLFPADYLWSTRRMDNLTAVILSELRHYERVDNESREARSKAIQSLESDATSGQAIFTNHCTGCHGREGKETAITPSLFERVGVLTTDELIATLLTGKNQMPSWAALDDQELAHIVRFLKETFSSQAQ